MSGKREAEHRWSLWCTAALMAPAAHIAGGMLWWETLAVIAAAEVVRAVFKQKGTNPRWYQPFHVFLLTAAAGTGLTWMEGCWPGEKEIAWIMGILLFLAVWMSGKGKEKAMDGSVALGFFTSFLFTAVLLSSVPDIRLELLKPEIVRSDWEKRAALLTLFLITGTGEERIEREGRKKGIRKTEVFSLLVSVCTQGLLSGRVAAGARAPYYMLSRSIRLFGTFEKMEALAWLGLMLGTFLFLTYLIGNVQEESRAEKHWKAVLMGIGAVVYYRFPIEEKSVKLLLLTIIICYIIPWILWLRQKKNNLEKFEKSG